MKGIDLTGRAGEVHAIMGPNGSGKSTLVHLLDRLYDLQEGRITIGGVDIRSFTRESLRSQIGLVLQEPFLFSQTIRENIAATRPGAPQEELRSAAAIACVDEAICEFPEGYETLVGERGVTLSGGQKQRVAIARALAYDAPVLLLDEPTSALDPELVGEVLDVIKKVAAQGYTMLLVSHEMNFIRHVSNRVIFLDKGHVVEDGTPKEVFEHPQNQRTREFFSKMHIMAQPEYVI